MPYTRSRARLGFEAQVRELKTAARRASLKRHQIPLDIKTLTFHAALLETSAGLEVYVKTLIEDYAYQAQSNSLRVEHLPPKLRSYVLFCGVRNAFEKYFSSGDEKELLNSLDLDAHLFDVAREGSNLNSSMRLTAVPDGRKYPSPRNWELLFRRLGINNLFGSVSSVLKRDAKSMLESFNDVRTAIAHESPPSLTKADVMRHLDNAIDFSRGVDRVAYRQLCAHGKHVCWPC